MLEQFRNSMCIIDKNNLMKAAIVSHPNQPPIYGDFETPIAGPDENSIAVTAAALSQLVKGRASGTHYSSSGKFPFVAGIDGVGRLNDGRRVYFILPDAPYGTMAEKVAVKASQCIPLPDDLDDITAAAIANPGMSSWAAFKERAGLVAGETVLVNGATGTSGRLAIQIAKYLGAGKVIATGRNVEALKSLKAIGADLIIPLETDLEVLEGAFKEQFANKVDVVIDYLWGQSAERLLIAAAQSAHGALPIRFIQVGAMSGGSINLPGAVLRSSAIELKGSGLGSISLDRLIKAIGEMLQAAIPGGFTIATRAIPLSSVEATWNDDAGLSRTVFVNQK
jgi:NADPH:quinone reductase-like Zn-dependent oxidoreductase